MNKTPVSVWSGEFELMGIVLRCHVLETGERIIEEASMREFWNVMADSRPITDSDRQSVERFARWMRGESA